MEYPYASFSAGGFSECFTNSLGVDYRGTLSVTPLGNTCMKWTVQSPHEHSYTPGDYPGFGLGDHNYCRNPSQESGGPWCYTTNPDQRWEYCNLLDNAQDSCPSKYDMDKCHQSST